MLEERDIRPEAVTKLYLDGNNLSELPGDIIKKLTRLRELTVTGNALKNVPQGIFKDLHELWYVNLKNNELNGAEKMRIKNEYESRRNLLSID